jgi:hypothetical protein
MLVFHPIGMSGWWKTATFDQENFMGKLNFAGQILLKQEHIVTPNNLTTFISAA